MTIMIRRLLNDKEAELVIEYLKDKDEFIKKTPDLAIKALGLHRKYIDLLAKYHIRLIKADIAMTNEQALLWSPWGKYAMYGSSALRS